MVNSGGAAAMETVRNYKMIYFTKTAWVYNNPSKCILKIAVVIIL